MLIPEDGCLPRITKSGLSAFNNVMIIKVPEQFRKPGETIYQLATLDRSKKTESWPADKYLDMGKADCNESQNEELDSGDKRNIFRQTKHRDENVTHKSFEGISSNRNDSVSSNKSGPDAHSEVNNIHHNDISDTSAWMQCQPDNAQSTDNHLGTSFVMPMQNNCENYRNGRRVLLGDRPFWDSRSSANITPLENAPIDKTLEYNYEICPPSSVSNTKQPSPTCMLNDFNLQKRKEPNYEFSNRGIPQNRRKNAFNKHASQSNAREVTFPSNNPGNKFNKRKRPGPPFHDNCGPSNLREGPFPTDNSRSAFDPQNRPVSSEFRDHQAFLNLREDLVDRNTSRDNFDMQEAQKLPDFHRHPLPNSRENPFLMDNSRKNFNNQNTHDLPDFHRHQLPLNLRDDPFSTDNSRNNFNNQGAPDLTFRKHGPPRNSREDSFLPDKSRNNFAKRNGPLLPDYPPFRQESFRNDIPQNIFDIPVWEDQRNIPPRNNFNCPPPDNEPRNTYNERSYTDKQDSSYRSRFNRNSRNVPNREFNNHNRNDRSNRERHIPYNRNYRRGRGRVKR